MTGPEHYRAAENLLAAVDSRDVPAVEFNATMAAAQVHATLALAAATALQPHGGPGLPTLDWQAWYAVACTQPQEVNRDPRGT